MKVLFSVMLLTFCMLASAQNRSVSGVITDDRNDPLPGVNIYVKGTSIGVTSDANGKYSISVPAPTNAVLVISFLGFQEEEIKLGDKSVVDVSLIEFANEMEEVVVVGYTSQKKATLTGAISVIDNKEIITTKSDNIQNSLTGKIAGVKVVEGSSEPGTFETDFSIRGQGTPLIIIDGVPRDNMTRLDPNEVESISILKDGSAAIYGARAANGVVIITTKQGQKDAKFSFEYTGHVGSESFIKDLQLLDATGYMSLINEKGFNRGLTTVAFGRSKFQDYEDGSTQSTDWIKPFINPHPINMQHSINARGGTKALTYFANFGYTNRQGRWESDATHYHRFNLRSNVTAQLAKGLEGKVMLNLMQEDSRTQPGDTWRIYNYSVNQLPTQAIFLPDPETGEPSEEYPTATLGYNLGRLLDPDKAGYDQRYQRLVQTNVSLEWKIPFVEGLNVKGVYSYDFRDDDTKAIRKMYNVYNAFYSARYEGDRYIQRTDQKYINDLLQFSLRYSKSFNKNHNVNASLFYEESSRRADNYAARRNTLFSSIEELFAGTATGQLATQSTSLSNLYHHANKAVVGSFVYDYRAKYIADFSFRYDGSSKFGPGYQWGFFPVGSLAWRLSEESFIKNNPVSKIITNLKLRASYGVLGDDRASLFQFVSGYEYPTTMATNYADGYYVLNDTPTSGVRTTGTPNQSITWFTAKSANVGMDFELWRGLLGGVVEVFQRNRSGLLATRQTVLPLESGSSLPDENLNSDLTRGLEVTLTHRHKVKDFHYNVSGYIAMDRTMDLYIERAAVTGPYDNWKNNMNNRWSTPNMDNTTGRKSNATTASNMFWGTEYLGQFQTMQDIFNTDVVYDGAGNLYLLPGDLIYNDWNHDGVIDGNDDHVIGSKHTTLSYGFTLSADYKGFDLSLTFQGTAGNRKRLGEIAAMFEKPVIADAGGLAAFADRWRRADEFDPTSSQEWVSGYYPSTYTDIAERQNLITRASTFWIVDASFLRLKTIEAGYTIPARLTKKIGVERARLFFNGYNMLTFSKMTLVDPEQSGVYPLVKTYRGGITITF
jgi:TonB-linked SusC/RagA family outer membrane protein